MAQSFRRLITGPQRVSLYSVVPLAVVVVSREGLPHLATLPRCTRTEHVLVAKRRKRAKMTSSPTQFADIRRSTHPLESTTLLLRSKGGVIAIAAATCLYHRVTQALTLLPRCFAQATQRKTARLVRSDIEGCHKMSLVSIGPPPH